jgi:hypothetical protein
MSFIPGSGIKKAHNVIETPIYPDIKKGPPQFKSAGKHWMVDPGRVMADLQSNNQHIDGAVLAVSRDSHQYKYGKSSHRDVVNLAFRPALVTIEDIEPLSRRRRQTVVPRINPQTSHDGFKAKNDHQNNVTDHITDKVNNPFWDAGYYKPIDAPVDNAVLPDLKMKMPAFAQTAGFEHIIETPVDNSNLQIRESNRPDIAQTAGINSVMTIDAPAQEVVLDHNQLTTPLESGFESSIDGQTYTMHERDLSKVQRKQPNYSIRLNPESQYRSRNESTKRPEFRRKNISTTHGYTSGGAIPVMNMNRPIQLRPTMK